MAHKRQTTPPEFRDVENSFEHTEMVREWDSERERERDEVENTHVTLKF